MCEILFRGKTQSGKWVEGFYHYSNWINPITKEFVKTTYSILPIGGQDAYGAIPETIGQYTGLTDKNGTKIFEGDIIAGAVNWQERPKNGVVAFKNGSFGLIWYRGDAEQFNPFTSMCNVEYEVIGNVHDNPDLLEVSDNA